MTTQTTNRPARTEDRRDTPVGFSFWDFCIADLLASIFQAIFVRLREAPMRTFIVGTIIGFVFGGTVLDFFIAFATTEVTFTVLDKIAYGLGDAWHAAINQ